MSSAKWRSVCLSLNVFGVACMIPSQFSKIYSPQATLRIFTHSGLVRTKSSSHDDVIKMKYFPRYWPFVRGIHRSPANFLHKGQWRGALIISLILRLNKQLSKQSWGWWFETLWRSSWRHRNEYSIRPLVQIMAWHPFGTKPLSPPTLVHCQLDPEKHISMKF